MRDYKLNVCVPLHGSCYKDLELNSKTMLCHSQTKNSMLLYTKRQKYCILLKTVSLDSAIREFSLA